MKLYSIIVPVYNVSRYLEQCVNSLLAQNLQDTEIILVDDGSKDNSGRICDDFAAKNACIKVIHKKNGGLSSARNAGLQKAEGEYVSFVDSDDWWNPEVSVSSILEQVKIKPNIEMFLYTSLDYYEGKGTFRRKEHENLPNIRTDTVEMYYQDLIQNGNLEVSAATKLLKRSFLIEHDLFFRDGILSEDNEWMLRLLRVLSSVAIINEPLYICRMGRQGSITHTIGKKNITDLLWIIDSSIAFYKNNDSKVKHMELNYCSYLWFSALGLSNKLEKSVYKEVKSSFKESSFVCKFSSSRKTKMSYVIYKLFGLDVTRRILGTYIMLKGRHIFNKTKTD